MTMLHDQQTRPEVVLDALLDRSTRVAGDLIEIESDTWAIHGVIPVDGEVILAEFPRPDEARAVLARLAIVEQARARHAAPAPAPPPRPSREEDQP